MLIYVLHAKEIAARTTYDVQGASMLIYVLHAKEIAAHTKLLEVT